MPPTHVKNGGGVSQYTPHYVMHKECQNYASEVICRKKVVPHNSTRKNSGDKLDNNVELCAYVILVNISEMFEWIPVS